MERKLERNSAGMEHSVPALLELNKNTEQCIFSILEDCQITEQKYHQSENSMKAYIS